MPYMLLSNNYLFKQMDSLASEFWVLGTSDPKPNLDQVLKCKVSCGSSSLFPLYSGHDN